MGESEDAGKQMQLLNVKRGHISSSFGHQFGSSFEAVATITIHNSLFEAVAIDCANVEFFEAEDIHLLSGRSNKLRFQEIARNRERSGFAMI
eukprot:scaffold44947_cov81-Cyclotella_meneghiniana.AAC.1